MTKYSRSVAKLTPVADSDRELLKEAIERIKTFAQKHTLGNVDWKNLRDEDRC